MCGRPSAQPPSQRHAVLVGKNHGLPAATVRRGENKYEFEWRSPSLRRSGNVRFSSFSLSLSPRFFRFSFSSLLRLRLTGCFAWDFVTRFQLSDYLDNATFQPASSSAIISFRQRVISSCIAIEFHPDRRKITHSFVMSLVNVVTKPHLAEHERANVWLIVNLRSARVH